MSLADELLADLEEDDQTDLEELLEQKDVKIKKEEIETEVSMEIDVEKIVSIRQLAKLRDSDLLKSIIKQIESYKGRVRKSEDIIGPVEADPEYQLIVEANNIAADIDNEIATIHRFVREKYQKRFPELDSLVIQPLEYVMTVKELGNDLDQAKNNETLQTFLTQATIMVVSVTASTTQGIKLSPEELERIFEACDMAIELNSFKLRIYEYVESRMALIAPNVSAIVGAAVAAQIMGAAGGLTRLAKMPACNLFVLGQKKLTGGFSQRTTNQPHVGFVYQCELVQDAPPDLRRRAARLVAAKCILAARVDACHEPGPHVGLRFREDIVKKLDKLQEPPPVKLVRPLPKPVEQARKKRGGRRVRKMKERYAMTEFRKSANRMCFAEIEEDAYQEDLGYTRGAVGRTGAAGRIRLPQVDEKTKVRISKTLQKNLQKQQAWGGSTSVRRQVSGTASSVAFTPLQVISFYLLNLTIF